jgi:hypothetical protein
MKTLRSSVALLAVYSLFAGSLVHADDCSDALLAESCACRSDVRREGEHLRGSDKNSASALPSKARKSTGPRFAQRTKRAVSPSYAAVPRGD